MPRKILLTYAVLLVMLVGAAAAALTVGPGRLSDVELRAVYLDLRATRAVAAFLVGAALAVGGVVVQGLFRNPLVSPSILGTTAGASLGGQLVLLAAGLWPRTASLTWVTPDMLVPAGCLLGAAGSLGLVLLFARGDRSPLSLLLMGLVLSSLFLSIGAFVTSLAQESWDVGRAVVAFTLGGLGGVGHRHLAVAAPLIVAGAVASFSWARSLDLFLSGEEESATLGLDVGRTRLVGITWVAVLTAAAVALGGNIGFVGLVVPHALRPLVGASHRRLLPAAALGGGVFVLVCEVVSRAMPGRSEVPLGVVTGLVGAPIFLYLLARTQREVEHG